MYDAKIDNDKPGKQGFVQGLLQLFQTLLDLQPYFEQNKFCYGCEASQKKNVRLPLPMKIHDVGHLNYNSIQRYLEWFVEPKHAQSCQVLSSSS